MKQSSGSLDPTTANRGKLLGLEQQEGAQEWLWSRTVSTALGLWARSVFPSSREQMQTTQSIAHQLLP